MAADADGIDDVGDPDIVTTQNLGIGKDQPRTKFQVHDGNMFLSKISSGLILKDEERKCWLLKVNTNGKVTSTLIECPQ